MRSPTRNRIPKRRTSTDAHSVATAACINRLIDLEPNAQRDRDELSRVTPPAELNRAIECLITMRRLMGKRGTP